MLTHLSLFSGVGGLDLAAEAVGFTTVGQCEWADYPTRVLEKHWPDVPRWKDIRTLTGSDFYARTGLRTVDIISGGFPCQPFSVAGKRRGKEDDRYLWPEMCRVISEIRPSWVIGENVPGIIDLALDTVLSDLANQGYTCQTFIVPAAGVDAPHRRERICIVGYSEHNGLSSAEITRSTKATSNNHAQRQDPACEPERAGRFRSCEDVAYSNGCGQFYRESAKQSAKAGKYAQCESCRCSEDVADTHSDRLEEPRMQRLSQESGVSTPDFGWWPAEPDVGRVANGIPSRVDRLKCLGNAVVPQQFYPFFKYIAEIEIEDMNGGTEDGKTD